MTSRRLLSSGLAVALATGLVASGLVAAGPSASAAPSLTDAKKQAAALAAAVDKLTAQAEIASEDYDQAQEQLGQAVTAYLGYQQQLAQAEADDTAGRSALSQQAIALYEAGGPAPLYAEALNGSDLGEAVDQMSLAGDVMRSQQLTVARSAGQAQKMQALNAKLAKAASDRTRLQAAAARNATTVRGLLAQQTQLLASANAHVRQVAVQLQQEAEQKAAQQFQHEMDQARSLAQAQNALIGTAPAPTAAAAAALAAAETREGTPYVWGATGPGDFDCSGLTSWAYAQAGVGLPRTSREQWFVGAHVSLADLQPGDLLFWATNTANPATIHHVAMYAGNGWMIAAPHTGAVVSLQRVYLPGFIGATRPTVPAGAPTGITTPSPAAPTTAPASPTSATSPGTPVSTTPPGGIATPIN